MENNATTPSTSERRTTLTPQQLKAVRRCLKFLHKKIPTPKTQGNYFPNVCIFHLPTALCLRQKKCLLLQLQLNTVALNPHQQNKRMDVCKIIILKFKIDDFLFRLTSFFHFLKFQINDNVGV